MLAITSAIWSLPQSASSWQNTAVHSAGGHGGGKTRGCCGDSGEPEMQMLHSMGASVALDTFLGTSGLVVCGAGDWQNKVTLRMLLLCSCNGVEVLSMKAPPAPTLHLALSAPLSPPLLSTTNIHQVLLNYITAVTANAHDFDE